MGLEFAAGQGCRVSPPSIPFEKLRDKSGSLDMWPLLVHSAGTVFKNMSCLPEQVTQP